MGRLVSAVVGLCAVAACSQGIGGDSGNATLTFGLSGATGGASVGESTGADDGGDDGEGGSGSGDDSPSPTSQGIPGDDSGTGGPPPPPNCGDGVLDADEECDAGAANADTAACKSDCTNQVCGDGFTGPGEGCDDANGIDDDACSNSCALASCGDGVVNASEGCDDGNSDDSDACPSTCQPASCGDGFVRAGMEECDGSGESAACDADCTNASCGDGHVNAAAGEGCDDGNGDAGDACTTACQAAACGDGFLHQGVEECDDGNTGSGDGCSATCTSEFPDACEQGTDPGTGAPWVVCSADANGAWISANSTGTYHANLICQNLGYSGMGVFGGTCGNVCGFCEGATSCSSPGTQTFEGSGACGSDALGPLLCYTVMWTCVP